MAQAPGARPSQIVNQLRRGGVKVRVHTARQVMTDAGYRPPKAFALAKMDPGLLARRLVRDEAAPFGASVLVQSRSHASRARRLLVLADRYYGRVEEMLARIEADAGRDAADLLDIRDRCLELFKVTSRGGVPEIWLLGPRLLGASGPPPTHPSARPSTPDRTV